MEIYGAGLAGLLTAHMLRRFKPVIREAQPSLPNNHEALLRFRTDAVSRATGIPFRKVTVDKSIRWKGRVIQHPDLQLNNTYSFKVTGEFHPRSIGDLRSVERYVAPGNFIEQMSRSCDIRYGCALTRQAIEAGTEEPFISTIPMPALMDIVHWPHKPVFNFRTIWSVWTEITRPKMELYQTIYYPDPDVDYYRASITGNKLILEYSNEPVFVHNNLMSVAHDFGLIPSPKGCNEVTISEPQVKEQKYGKLAPIEEAERRRFILAMSDKFRVYSIGRFATWRQILLDDVVNDVTQVERLIVGRDDYQERLAAMA